MWIFVLALQVSGFQSVNAGLTCQMWVILELYQYHIKLFDAVIFSFIKMIFKILSVCMFLAQGCTQSIFDGEGESYGASYYRAPQKILELEILDAKKYLASKFSMQNNSALKYLNTAYSINQSINQNFIMHDSVSVGK